jgi:hypothetical protein
MFNEVFFLRWKLIRVVRLLTSWVRNIEGHRQISSSKIASRKKMTNQKIDPGPITRSSSRSGETVDCSKLPQSCLLYLLVQAYAHFALCCRKVQLVQIQRGTAMPQPTSRHLWNNARRLQEESRRLRETMQKKSNRPNQALEVSKSTTESIDSVRRRRRSSAPRPRS